MTHAIICIVESENEADRIVGVLRTSGFENDAISALVPDKAETAQQQGKPATKATEGATTGAKTGLVIGGALGLLAGVGFLAIPGLGPFIAAGPLMAAIGGAALGGSAGGVAGGLIGLGIHEDDAKHYESQLREGNILLSVHTENPDLATKAEDIFKSNGAREIKRTKKRVETAK